MQLNLAGQTAIVTGGSSGIGQACAIALGREKVNVVVNYHSDRAGANRAVAAIEAEGGRAFHFQADVSQEEQVDAMLAACIDRFGALDILVSNAGLQKDAPFTEMTLAQWQAVLAVDLDGQFLCTRAAARQFRRQGIRAGVSKAAGKIIVMSSVHDEIPWAGHANYAAAKGGLKQLMETLAQELGPDKIRVNSISPGAIATDINREVWENEERRNELLRLVPYGRMGQPEDVADLCLFLASDRSDYITGASIYIDGGMMLYPGFRDNG
jgi:glucose 1-dehydrogenase